MALKARMKSKFPARVVGGVGIDVARTGATYSFALDFSDFAATTTVSAGDRDNLYAPFYNEDAEQYTRISLSTMLGGFDLAASSTDNAIVRFNGTAGGTQDSEVLIDDTGNITPVTSGAGSLGTPDVRWSAVQLTNGSALSFNNDIIVQHSTDHLAFTGGTYSFDGSVRPATNGGAALGTTTLGWSNVHVAQGGAVSFAGGSVTITHGTSSLSIGGASGGIFLNAGTFVNGQCSPLTTGAGSLGSTARQWATTYIQQGAGIDWNAGSATITYSTGTVSFGGATTYAFSNAMRLAAVSTPSAPASSNLSLFAKTVSSRTVPHFIDSSSREIPLGSPQLLGYAIGVDFNAVADTAITINLPYGWWRLSVVGFTNTGTTASLTTAQYGLFTAAGGAGTALVSSGTALSGLTSNTINTNGSYGQTAASVSAYLNLTTVYFRVTQAQGAAASGNVYIIGFYLPTT
jgi:hypothetical protein